MSLPTIYAYLGGSFDPVHFGHLSMLTAAQNSLKLAKNQGKITQFECQLLPTKANPFKHNQTATTHRLAMLQLAISPKNSFIINTIETDNPQPSPSYTIDTLNALTAQSPNSTHIWIMGLDSLIGLPTWKNYKKINELANLWVFVRNANDNELNTILDALPDDLKSTIVFDFNALFSKKSGVIFIDKTPIPTISSTAIRQAFFDNQTSLLEQFVPKSVIDYANAQHLYD